MNLRMEICGHMGLHKKTKLSESCFLVTRSEGRCKTYVYACGFLKETN